MSDYFVHESSYIDDAVDIGTGTKIWHFCHILSHSKIGRDCNFGQNCVVGPNVILGDRVKVQNNVSIYDGVTCQNDVFIGPSVVFTNVINPRVAVNRRHLFQQTLLQEGATIGANATIICGVTIGRYALIGAGAVVTKDVPDFALMVGNPARQMGWVSCYGNRLQFDESGASYDEEECAQYQLREGAVSRCYSP